MAPAGCFTGREFEKGATSVGGEALEALGTTTNLA